MRTLALFLLLAGTASADHEEISSRRWIQAPASLLLYAHDGSLVSEIGLGEWKEEVGPGLIRERIMLGGVSKSGQFAWHWQRTVTIRRGRDDEVLSSTRTFVYFGTEGQVLWKGDIVDAPDGLPPIRISDDGETMVVLERGFDGWSAAAYTFTGNRILATPEMERVERFELTRNGRYVMVLGSGIDKPLVYTFFDLRAKSKKVLQAADAPLGDATLTNDGRVLFGKDAVFRFK
ncbi:MAG: hypothetical protein COB53_00025 [Elusimicrobia bacterium]|nr:MAG: hypothetical protein COB53_00025 [Elusimicrobiota bacterium]